MASIAAGNKIYWGSGINSLSLAGITQSDKVEIRNVNTGVSSFDCMIPKKSFNAVIKEDNIIFFTGDEGVSNHFEIYNIITDTWSTGILNQGVNGAAIISVNNTIYVAGGIVNGILSNQVWKLEF
jgi:hypothetical protein